MNDEHRLPDGEHQADDDVSDVLEEPRGYENTDENVNSGDDTLSIVDNLSFDPVTVDAALWSI